MIFLVFQKKFLFFFRRFSLRNNLTKSVFVQTAEELQKFIGDSRYECSDPELIFESENDNDNILLVNYKFQVNLFYLFFFLKMFPLGGIC